ncbi:glycosyltransferase family 4 protein [Polluticoccus soli]|uniref:glycosyltransferase family 4 protein n=1 Tax=Polluticoccus soli TaxID=3034150 RepID=UPI0023E33BF0|nr:glycosyltransferase family 4 protein [Flavipsychrobacter sp. JY13-12]
MKILILTPDYPCRNSVVDGIFIHQKVKALQQLGVECHVLLLRNWYPSFPFYHLHKYWKEGRKQHHNHFEEYEGVKIHSIPVFSKMPDRFFKNDVDENEANAIVKYIKNNPELRDANWLYAQFLVNTGFLGAKVKNHLGMKFAAIALGDDVHAWPEAHPVLREKLKQVFATADMLLANSKRLAADTTVWMDADKPVDVNVVYHGIDTNKFFPATEAEKVKLKEKYGMSADTKYLICVALPVKAKGWIELLESIKQLGNEFNGWKLLMVAPPRPGRIYLDVQEISVELGIEDRVHYLGRVPSDKLAEIMRASDAFILPSYNEGLANAVLEGMASGLACVTTDVGGHAEVVNNGQNGILIQPRSVDEVKSAISRVINDETLRCRLGSEARETMVEFGTYVKNAKRLLQLFEEHN